jgi:SAM-dependent methyltransferase
MKYLGYRFRDIARTLNPADIASNLLYRMTHRLEYPVPPAYLRVRAIATSSLPAYLSTGLANARGIRGVLESNGVDANAIRSILDYGCGAGRIIRQLPEIFDNDVRIWGIDRYGPAIRWCRRNLDFATFLQSEQSSELEDKSVDLIFASSVFTHLSPETEDRALRELLRLIRPAGSLLLTFRGKNYESRLSAKQLEILHRKGVLVRNPRADGENECDAYHTRDYIREKFGSLFDRMVHIESPVEFRVRDQAGYTDPGQDVWLFRAS